MKCFGKKQKLAIEYEIMNEVACFEFWVDNKPLCCYLKDGKRQQYKLPKWEISQIVDWLIENAEYIFDEIEFPLQVEAKSSREFLDKSGTFDSDDADEFDKWYSQRQDWFFRHSWYYNRGESWMAEIIFRRSGEKIEIEWNNTHRYEEIEFVNPEGTYYVDIMVFEQVINEFIEDYVSSDLKCFGKKQNLAIEYKVMKEVACFEFWVDNKPLCCYLKDGKRQKYKLTKYEISLIVDWLIENEQYILDEIEFPLQIEAKSSQEFLDKSGMFDSDDIDEFDKWYSQRQNWFFRHSWYYNRGGSWMAEIIFRRSGEKIEIEWNNTHTYEEIEFVNPEGIYYVDIMVFQQVISEFIEDYVSSNR